MKIASAASSLPPNFYPQEVLAAAASEYWQDSVGGAAFVERLFSRCGVRGRHLVLPVDEYTRLESWGEANDLWIENAELLASRALTCGLKRAGLSTSDLSAIFFTSITGISSPSIDARLINRMNLPRNIRRVPIFGLGCVAGAAAISRAVDYVRAYPAQVAAVIAVELCSLTIQRDNLSAANLISTGLFGDGCGVVLVSGANRTGAAGPEVLDTRSVFYPGTEHVMGWDISEKGFNIVLSKEVPDMVRKHLAVDVKQFLTDNGVTQADIGSWVIHTGGPAVLEAAQEALDLPAGALDASWHCLSKTGNLSSASVLLVLEETMLRRRPAPGTLGVMAAMGPGFCSELLLLRW